MGVVVAIVAGVAVVGAGSLPHCPTSTHHNASAPPRCLRAPVSVCALLPHACYRAPGMPHAPMLAPARDSTCSGGLQLWHTIGSNTGLMQHATCGTGPACRGMLSLRAPSRVQLYAVRSMMRVPKGSYVGPCMQPCDSTVG